MEHSVKDFPIKLAIELVEALWRGALPWQRESPPFTFQGQRNVWLAGHDDAVSPVEGYYSRLCKLPAGEAALVGIDQEGFGFDEAVSLIGSFPIVAIALEKMRHFEVSCPNKRFNQYVWPIILRFLEEV